MSHSPRWLAMQGRWDDASAVIERINPRHKRREMELLRRNVEESAGTSWRELLRPGMRGALIAGVGLAGAAFGAFRLPVRRPRQS